MRSGPVTLCHGCMGLLVASLGLILHEEKRGTNICELRGKQWWLHYFLFLNIHRLSRHRTTLAKPTEVKYGHVISPPGSSQAMLSPLCSLFPLLQLTIFHWETNHQPGKEVKSIERVTGDPREWKISLVSVELETLRHEDGLLLWLSKTLRVPTTLLKWPPDWQQEHRKSKPLSPTQQALYSLPFCWQKSGHFLHPFHFKLSGSFILSVL